MEDKDRKYQLLSWFLEDIPQSDGIRWVSTEIPIVERGLIVSYHMFDVDMIPMI
jgi:hypothetical protein